MSGKTISNRWRDWAENEPAWAYTALGLMATAFLGLIVHLAVLHGVIRQIGLIVMIVCGVGCEIVLLVRKQWAWGSFWGICVLLGVGLWEIASVIVG